MHTLEILLFICLNDIQEFFRTSEESIKIRGDERWSSPAASLASQLSESMMKVSKFGSSSDTSASTKSSKVGRLCSIPVNTPAQLRASDLSSS